MSGVFLEAQNAGITDDINNGNFRKALRSSEHLVSKFPYAAYSHAIKALVLEKMGRTETALESSINAKDIFLKYDADRIDDVTLSTMQMAFTRLGRFDFATACYVYACDKSPPNVERLVGLFCCHAREYSFPKQQQIAIKLYKACSEERFIIWAACSALLQVYCAKEPKELLLRLAESWIKKHINSSSLREPEALMVYIFVLEQQSKFVEAFEILSGEAGSILVFEFDKLRLQGRLLGRAGQYARAAGIFEEALKLCPDDWECFLHYLGCLLEDASSMCTGADGNPVYPPKPIDCRNLKLTDKVFVSRLSKASTFIGLLLRQGDNIALRGPHLAKLEIERTKLEYGKGDVNKFGEGIADYFCRFGGLSCFASDIESFLHTLEKHGKGEIWDEIISKTQSAGSSAGDGLQQSVALFKLKLPDYKLSTIDIDVLHKLAAQMTKMFGQALPFSKKYEIQEVMNCEELLSLTCIVLVQLFWRTGKIGYLLESIMIMEFGLSIRSLIWQYKILLLHLYSFWGCLPVAYEWYKSLDVKNILMESVQHHILPQMLVSPLWDNLNDLLGSYIGFMDEFLVESAEMSIFTYRHKSYTKVVEFVQFKQRLEQSSQYLVAKIESAILKLKQNAGSVQAAEGILKSLECGNSFVGLSDEIEMKPRTFNEDFELRPWWTPTPNKNYLLGPFEENYLPKETLIDEAKASALKTIKKRSLILRMIYLSLECASSSVKAHTEELKLLLERYASLLGYPFLEAADLVFGVSGGKKSLEILSLDIVDWMNFVVFLNAWNMSSHDLEESHPSTWYLVNSLLEMYIPEKVRSMGPLTSSAGNDLPVLVQLVTEPLTWHRLIIQSFVRPSVPSGKQKKGGAAVQSTHLQRQEIQDSVRSLYNVISEVTKWLNQQKEKPKEIRCEDVLSSVSNNEQGDEPGRIFSILQEIVLSSTSELHGTRIFTALQSWSATGVAAKLVTGLDTVLSEFLTKCEDNAKLLKGLMLRK